MLCAILVDICYRSGISAGKKVDIGLDGGCDKPLRPSDMLLYSWDGGLDVCVDLTGSLPLTHTGMADFVPGRAVIDVANVNVLSIWLSVRLLDIALGLLLEEIHVTWAHFEKKRTRLQLYTEVDEEKAYRLWRRR
ncbi:hypothetical protein Tco_0850693 [Tanacetum coccineum]